MAARLNIVVIGGLIIASAGCLYAQHTNAPGAIDLSKDKTLYVVSTAHLDTQWKWTIQKTIKEYIPKTLRDNFALFEKYPHYTFSFEGAFRYMLAKEYYPEEYARLKDYVAKGRWAVSGSFVDACDVNIPSPESLIRQILYGNNYFRREFGKTSRDIFLPDCFGFGYALPSVEAHCGLIGFSSLKLRMGCWLGYGGPFNIGMWEGVDGSRVVAALKPYDFDLRSNFKAIDGSRANIDKLGSETGVYADYRYIFLGDQGRAPGTFIIEPLEKAVTSYEPLRVLSAASDQFYRDLTPAQMAKLPVYKGELLLTEHSTGCYTSQTAMKRWNRKNELLADAAERAAVAADLLGGSRYPRELLTENWIRFLWHQFHDDLTGTSIPEAYTFSWNDEIIALNRFASVLEHSAAAVAAGMDTRAEGAPLVVFNPLAIEREDIVEANVNFPGGAPKAVRVFNAAGVEVPSQVGQGAGQGTTVLFLASVQPVSFSVFDVRPAEKCCEISTGLKCSTSAIENSRYMATLDARGDMASVKDKALGKELLDGPARLEVLAESKTDHPQWEILYKDVKAAPVGCIEGNPQVRILERGPARVSLEVARRPAGDEALGASSVVQRWRLAAGKAGDRLECETEIQWAGRKRLLKAAFPLKVSNQKATYDLGLGVIQRGNNQPKLYEVPAQQWADVSAPDDSMGVAVLNDCKYGWDKPTNNILRLTLIHSPEGARVWGDAQDNGHHELLYAIYGHEGGWSNGGVAWQAARLNQPLAAFETTPHAGKLGRQFSLLSVNTRQVAVRAVKQAEDSDEVVVRLQELEGKPAGNASLSFVVPISSAREVNGAEEAMGEAPVKDGKLVVNLRAYQPRAFALKLAKPEAQLTAPICQPVGIAYDRGVTSSDGKTAQNGLDASGRSIPAELFPPSVSFEGITYKLGQAADGAKNALLCNGQTLSLPAGEFNRLYVLAAAAEDGVKGSFAVDGKGAEFPIAACTGFVGQWDTDKAPAYIKRDAIAWVGTHCHDKSGKNEPYVFSYLFRYVIDLPRGAKEVKVPDGGKILLFAATAARDPGAGTKAAQLLY